MECSLLSSSVHGILWTRILVWVAISSPRDLPNQELNPFLLHCRQVLYQLSYEGFVLVGFKISGGDLSCYRPENRYPTSQYPQFQTLIQSTWDLH